MSVFKAFFGLGKIPRVVKFFEFESFDDVNRTGGAIAQIREQVKEGALQLTKAQKKFLDDQMRQVEMVFEKIQQPATSAVKKTKEKVADIFDLKGRKMDPTKSIIGGEQAGIMGIEKTSPKFIEYAIRNIKEMKSPQSVKDEINFIIKREGMYKNLTSDDAKQILDAIEPIVKKADGGRAGFRDGTGMFEKLFFNKEKPIFSGFSTAELFDLIVSAKDAAGPLIGFADGGRIGYKDGPKDPRRRTFMKAAAGLASLLPFGAAKIVGKAAPVVAKAAEVTGPALAKIVETVMSLGKLVSVKGRRVKEMVTKKKHEGVEVTEDIQDQSYIIKKGDKEIYYKPGRMDETGGIDDDIIQIIEKRIQKAGGGGIGYMLGE